MARVAVENLTKIFKGAKGESIPAVSNLNLVVEDKEFLVLVGPSGCGKTTTLRLIAGLEEVTSGTISIDGRVINSVLPKDRDIAMVFQNHALYPHMTTYENMTFGLEVRKLPKQEIDQRVRDAAEMLGLIECLDRKPEALSGGQRQRVALGRAIVRKPKVFLFDEPLSNLDAPMRLQMRKDLRKLHAQLGCTMIYVTHDQTEAMSLGDRIAVMNSGTLQQVAAPNQVYHHPANMFVAKFIGSPPMNFFEGTIEQSNGGISFTASQAFTVGLEKSIAARLTEYSGKKIILGLRPEHIMDSAHSPSSPAEWNVEATVEFIEPIGAETHLHLSSGEHSFIARVQATDTYTQQQKLSLVFDMRQPHFFDPKTEQAIA
ncbi:MAG: transporter related [Pedosphaera sp.]|nr:transporter related [Pedosphaera sp.]